jgi:ADP-ribosylglycohydrolase
MKISKLPWMKYADDLHYELVQAWEEGKDVTGIEEEINEIQALDLSDPSREHRAGLLLDKLSGLPIREGYKYIEPEKLHEIQAARPVKRFPLRSLELSEEQFLDKIYGAWLGRSAGCLLGQPVEGWRRERLVGFMKDTGNYPFQYYMSSNVSQDLINKYEIKNRGQVYGGTYINWINNVQHMVEDDDMNYTIIGLAALEKHGLDFTPDDIAECWLMNLPFLHVCVTERIAYKNMIHLIEPPLSASYRNVYRESVGARIRGDLFGYVNPGNPELAADMAWRDACISHTKNAVYGEMWIAAMLAAAAATNDIEEIIHAGLAEIPENCRLAEDILRVIKWKKDGINWEEASHLIHQQYDESFPNHWWHVNPNSMIVTTALLYGESDFEKSIGISVSIAFDTDCNGATVGSILGIMIGAKGLPEKWISPLKDLIKSGVDGFGLIKISELAKRTVDLIKPKQEGRNIGKQSLIETSPVEAVVHSRYPRNFC